MQEMAISKFKATCLAVLEKVRRTGQPIRVTRRGKPLADIVPTPASGAKRQFGAMRGTATLLGDIVGPIGSEDDWNAARGILVSEEYDKKELAPK